MNSEKVKEIKKALECCVDSIKYGCEGCPYHKSSSDCQELLIWDMQAYINELESENGRLMKLQARGGCRVAELGIENQQLKDRIADLESELEKEQINNLNCDTELQYKEKRIAELEKENDEQYKRIMELEQDLVHADEKVFYRECNVTLRENEIKQQAIKQFAEKVKDSIEEYRLENEYFTENEPNGNLWQMNASVFCIEVTQDGGLIDQLAKEYLNEIAKDYGVEL